MVSALAFCSFFKSVRLRAQTNEEIVEIESYLGGTVTFALTTDSLPCARIGSYAASLR